MHGDWRVTRAIHGPSVGRYNDRVADFDLESELGFRPNSVVATELSVVGDGAACRLGLAEQ